jgi:potassium/chloride transporter 9
MISRALGPEFGGSVGIIFYLANVFACSINTLGFVEALTTNLAKTTGILAEVLPNTDEWRYLYGTIALVFCLVICLVGAGLFAMASVVIFVAVMIALVSVMVSFVVVSPRWEVVESNSSCNSNTSSNSNTSTFSYNHTQAFGFQYLCHCRGHSYCARYTSWSKRTLSDNLYVHMSLSSQYAMPSNTKLCVQPSYVNDYSNGMSTDFIVIFSVLFNGVTGIMGVKMSIWL